MKSVVPIQFRVQRATGLGCDAAKMSIKDGKRVKKEIKNYLVLDVVRLQGFLKNVKVLVGQPSHPKQG